MPTQAPHTPGQDEQQQPRKEGDSAQERKRKEAQKRDKGDPDADAHKEDAMAGDEGVDDLIPADELEDAPEPAFHDDDGGENNPAGAVSAEPGSAPDADEVERSDSDDIDIDIEVTKTPPKKAEKAPPPKRS